MTYTQKTIMTELETLAFALKQFADLTADEFKMSISFWNTKKYKKGDFFNQHKNICRYLGFINTGTFRSYVIDNKTAEEKNVFLYSKNQFVVPFKSFINQTPCDYHTQAMTDSAIHYIHIDDLQTLYKQSHKWERFGRLMAQMAFNVTIERMESFIFKTPEERYLDLINTHPDIFKNIPLYHISSYLGIQGPSLSRIRKRISGK
jgi:signal-transduction protein with cAMP-binding, CBS, and nucleotidyltransferase domain